MAWEYKTSLSFLHMPWGPLYAPGHTASPVTGYLLKTYLGWALHQNVALPPPPSPTRNTM